MVAVYVLLYQKRLFSFIWYVKVPLVVVQTKFFFDANFFLLSVLLSARDAFFHLDDLTARDAFFS